MYKNTDVNVVLEHHYNVHTKTITSVWPVVWAIVVPALGSLGVPLSGGTTE